MEILVQQWESRFIRSLTQVDSRKIQQTYTFRCYGRSAQVWDYNIILLRTLAFLQNQAYNIIFRRTEIWKPTAQSIRTHSHYHWE